MSEPLSTEQVGLDAFQKASIRALFYALADELECDVEDVIPPDLFSEIARLITKAKVEAIQDMQDHQDEIPGSRLIYDSQTVWLHTSTDVSAWLRAQEARYA